MRVPIYKRLIEARDNPNPDLHKLTTDILALFSVGSSTVLKYTDYKIEQALWIQKQNEKRTNRGTNTEQFCIECYWYYLNLIGYEKTETYNKMEKYLNNIGTYHLTTGDDFYNRGYDKKIADNINELMDKVLM